IQQAVNITVGDAMQWKWAERIIAHLSTLKAVMLAWRTDLGVVTPECREGGIPTGFLRPCNFRRIYINLNKRAESSVPLFPGWSARLVASGEIPGTGQRAVNNFNPGFVYTGHTCKRVRHI
ncbi:MAG TPA: hypothetical protein VJ508_19040, partial [Saprospiraceae bacterium]|nr:hypothetical protein [Saprospiraceae bacterium]